MTFNTPTAVRDALPDLARGVAPEPFHSILGLAARVPRGD
jgi:hypothetical protein